MRHHALALVVVLVACGEETPMPTDAGVSVAPDGGVVEADGGVDVVDAGPRRRRLLTRSIVPREEAQNLVVVPDFETKMPNGSWVGLSLDPNATTFIPIEGLTWSRTPTVRPEVVRVPGTDVAPMGVLFVGLVFANKPGLDVSVWVGIDATQVDSFDQVESGMFVYEPELGARVIDVLGRPETDQTIDALVWRRYDVLTTVPIVGRIYLAVQNLRSGPIFVNGPRVIEVNALVVGASSWPPQPSQLGALRGVLSPRPRRIIAPPFDLPAHFGGSSPR